MELGHLLSIKMRVPTSREDDTCFHQKIVKKQNKITNILIFKAKEVVKLQNFQKRKINRNSGRIPKKKRLDSNYFQEFHHSYGRG